MIWNKKEMVPPLSKQAMALGNTDGGHSVPLIFKHQSGKLSFGDAVIHKGEVAWWYPGDMADVCHVPESKNPVDPIVEWTKMPAITDIVKVFGETFGMILEDGSDDGIIQEVEEHYEEWVP